MVISPINRNTMIEYSVETNHRSSLSVDLSIYNLLGQKIKTLVDETRTAGLHQAV